jgi:hypothetical protein
VTAGQLDAPLQDDGFGADIGSSDIHSGVVVIKRFYPSLTPSQKRLQRSSLCRIVLIFVDRAESLPQSGAP